MKSILIIGAKENGKSTTINEVCKQLNPSQIWKLILDKKSVENAKIISADLKNIYNDTFIIEVDDKLILILSGCPTEQDVKLLFIFESCKYLKLDIQFIVVAKRLIERKKGFKTESELKQISELIHSERIEKIMDLNYRNNSQWNARIDKLVKLILKSNYQTAYK